MDLQRTENSMILKDMASESGSHRFQSCLHHCWASLPSMWCSIFSTTMETNELWPLLDGIRWSLEDVLTTQHRENPQSVRCPQPSCSRLSKKDSLYTKGLLQGKYQISPFPGKKVRVGTPGRQTGQPKCWRGWNAADSELKHNLSCAIFCPFTRHCLPA